MIFSDRKTYFPLRPVQKTFSKHAIEYVHRDGGAYTGSTVRQMYRIRTLISSTLKLFSDRFRISPRINLSDSEPVRVDW